MLPLLVALLSPVALAEPWHGTINQALEQSPARRVAAPFDLTRLASRIGATVDGDLAALPATVSLLYGDAQTNPGLARVLAYHHIALDAGGVTLGGVRIAAPDPFFIAALPNPEHPEWPVIVYTAWRTDAQPGLNRVFHGPTPIVVGSTEDHRADWAGDWRADAEGALVGLRIGAPVLTREEAKEDLRVLGAQIERGWAGLEDLDHALAPETWAGRLAAAEARLDSQAQWSWSETWTVLGELLAPIHDTHFSLEGGTITPEGSPISVSARLSPDWRPFFADGRLTGDEGAWALDGAPISEVPPPVPGPHEVALGVPYRFPTVLADGRPAWLLGVFAAPGETPTLTLAGRSLPVHAPRGASSASGEPWTLSGRALTVRTMAEQRLDGLAETALGLRARDRVVLDLRGNGGGSDQPAMDWVTALHGGPYRWTPGVDLVVGDGPRAERLHPWPEGRIGRRARGRSAYQGRLLVLMDGGVASSGETFVQLAAQVPGALLYGTPTAGCSRYGNLLTQEPLPHTGLVATFGHTAFQWDGIRPVVEGVGIFPDIWLDEADPVAFVGGLP